MATKDGTEPKQLNNVWNQYYAACIGKPWPSKRKRINNFD